jgi:hypothetical protein
MSSVSHGLSALCVLGMASGVERCWTQKVDLKKSLQIFLVASIALVPHIFIPSFQVGVTLLNQPPLNPSSPPNFSECWKAAMAATPIRPRVFLDVSIGTEPIGRLVIELFADKAPKTVEK